MNSAEQITQPPRQKKRRRSEAKKLAMNSAEQITQAPQQKKRRRREAKKLAAVELKNRLQELREENEDLRKICKSNGIKLEDKLAAQRHRRLFARICLENPLTRLVTATEALSIAGITRIIAQGAGSLLGLSLASRGVFAALNYVTLQNPWRLGFLACYE